MPDIEIKRIDSVGHVGWWIDGGDGNRYYVSEKGEVMRPLKPYHKGKSSKVYFNVVVAGKLRRVAADRLAEMTRHQ